MAAVPLLTGPFDPGAMQAALNTLIEAFNARFPSPVVITGTAHTLGAVDVGNNLEFTNAAGSTLTIPTGVIGGGSMTTIIDQTGTAGVTIDVSSGVTLLSANSATTGSGGIATLIGVADDQVAFGGQVT